MNPTTADILMHYGVKRRSGRYPWGSGETPYQHSGDFLSRVEMLKKNGMSEKEIADEMKLTTTEFRVAKQVASHERRQLLADRARSLREDGKSLNEIAEIMGFSNDSSVRALLNENTLQNKNKARVTADIIKAEVEKNRVIDVGKGVEQVLGISSEKLNEALYILEAEEGYIRAGIGIPQVTNPGQQTNTMVLCKTEEDYNAAYNDRSLIQPVKDYHSVDGGFTYQKLQYPASIDSDRIEVRYGDQGGTAKDGVIEIRRGVDDLSLGNSHYAQVRILVDGTHYLKGMALYADDLPEGVDIRFNTNKKTGTDKMDVLKEIKKDPDNPFGAVIKANGQSTYLDSDGNERLSAINKLKEEGDWDTMSKNLSQQFLSKQPLRLIEKQLDLTYKDALDEYEEICAYTNPTIKRKLLDDFAGKCDSATVHLKAAALPGQSTKVILPITELKENEVYAPTYPNGSQVALVRYPHGHISEIPVLTVNNKNQSAKRILGPNITDAIGINEKVAGRLSGADFDGDQVVVIPTNNGKVKIKTDYELRGLKGFEPKDKYSTDSIRKELKNKGLSDAQIAKELKKQGISLMPKSQVQKQMGMISNLITDMTLRGADENEIARAIRHSMVVIDAEKHKLNYRQSEKDNGIAELKEQYQGGGGASTLLSQRKQNVEIPERQGSRRINIVGKSYYDPNLPEGAETYKESGRTYKDPKTGKIVPAMEKVPLMSVTKDARTLSSGTLQENAYADYANKMKALANRARVEMVDTGRLVRDANASRIYQTEVDSLKSKLNIAARNAPRERRAQAIANSVVKAKQQENPDMDKKELKKARQIAINNARIEVGASGKYTRIVIEPKEWEAIQAGAISDNQLSEILRYTDADHVRQLAMPRTTTQLSTARVNKVKAMAASGYTNAQIAEAMGVSKTTVSKYLNNKEEGDS